MNGFQDAFISYGRADSKAFAIKLYQRLQQQGRKIWFDQNDIPLGVDFQNQIDDGIETSHNFLFIIAPHSVNSPYCRKEIELAVQRNKRIIPLLHVEQISRETWQQRYPQGTDEEWEAYQAKGLHSSFPNMHPEIGKINWVYFREGIDDFEQSLTGLLDVFERHQDYVYQHTSFLAQALAWQRHHQSSRYLLIGEEYQQAEQWLKIRFKDEQPPCIPTDLQCEFITESIKNAQNLMTQVFLSYAVEDKEVMVKIRNSLRRECITVWTNQSDIQTGEVFAAAIQRGIEQADNVVYLLSPDSLQSDYCQQEWQYALSLNKRIIPVLVRDTPLEEIPNLLRHLQYIDLTDNVKDEDYRLDESQLLRVIRQDAAYYNEHKILLTKALKWDSQHRNPSILLRGYNLRHAEAWLKVAKQRTSYLPTGLQEEFIAESLRQPPASSLDVFISYSRADSDFARQLNDALQMQGKTTWFDQESIASGTEFQVEIYRGIEVCDNFLFILSPPSVDSPYCADEVEYAVKLNKRIVTVLYRPINSATLHPELAKVQRINFNQDEQGFWANFNQLVRTLDTDRDHLRVHTRLLTRAMEWDREGREPSFLLRGKDLESSEQWLKQARKKEPKSTQIQNEYIITSRKFPLRKPKLSTVFLSSIAASILVIGIRFLGVLQPLEMLAYDHLMRQRASEPIDERFLIVEVTDDDIEWLIQNYPPGYGTVPDLALNQLLEKLEQYQPRLIGLDTYRDFKTGSNLAALATRLRENHRLITVCKLGYRNSKGIKPPPDLSPSAIPERVGFSDLIQDRDSIVRRHLLVQASDEYCPTIDAFSLVIARRYLEAEGKVYKAPFSTEGYYLQPLQFSNTLFQGLSAFAGGYQGQSDADVTYQTLLNYRLVNGNPSEFAPRVRLRQVLDNQISETDIKDRIILIGITAKISADDYFFTPYGEMVGVVIQAQMASQIISTVLDGRALMWWLPRWGDWLWIGVWSWIAGGMVWQFQRPLYIVVAGGLSCCILYGIVYIIFVNVNGWIPLIPAGLNLVTTGVFVIYITAKFSH